MTPYHEKVSFAGQEGPDSSYNTVSGPGPKARKTRKTKLNDAITFAADR
jgi:hypothetical protein